MRAISLNLEPYLLLLCFLLEDFSLSKSNAKLINKLAEVSIWPQLSTAYDQSNSDIILSALSEV